ncbi:MAG TPA: prolipoprotein diacylglyceryl transferase family protein [Phycisphaerae bacterium]|nr:prolipoprotein diacylglyceryl transferase family protein [Phycisphaerae bacterium]
MHPTVFKIPYLPEWLADIKSYGVMMMIAFLTGIWMACRRAMRSQANPDIVLNLGFISLIAGVAGARIMFVWHYWDTRFANQPHPWAAVFDIRAGGLEFWGGPLLTIPAIYIYLRFFAKASARWYMDMLAPSLAWGLAITRIGCFLNGCCWGSVCVDQHDPARMHAEVPWAVRFPYGSPAMLQQYHFGQLTLPRELLYQGPTTAAEPIAREFLDAAIADDGKTLHQLRENMDAAARRAQATTQSDAEDLQRNKDALAEARKAYFTHQISPVGLVEQQASRYGLTVRQLAALADHYRSKPVHPTQLYEMISGMLISWLLSIMFYYRRRHGILLPWFLILYSISRYLLEAIRQDNPLDVGGVTISQAISFGTFAAGVIALIYIYKALPEIGPGVKKFVLPDDEPPTARPIRA